MDWKGILKKVALAMIIPAVLAMIGAIGFGVFWFFLRVTPESVMEKAVTSARQRNVEVFRTCFSDVSVQSLETSWRGDAAGSGSWSAMMTSILEASGAPPEIGEVEMVGDRAKIKIRVRGERRNVFLVKQANRWMVIEDWRLDVLSGIDEGLSPEARKAQAADTVDEAEIEKRKALLEAPQEKGWWVKDEKKGK